jgi:tetratricopeptide (TPR) repeat protein
MVFEPEDAIRGVKTRIYELTGLVVIILLLCSATVVRALPSSQSESQLESQAHIFYNDGKYLQTIFLLKQVIKLDPKNPTVLTNLGAAEDEASNFTGALYYFKKALVIDPHNLATLTDQGAAIDELGNHTGAIEYDDKALAIDPHDVYALYNKGAAIDELGNHTGAIEYDDKALAIDPHDVYALYNKGYSLDELGNHIGAIESYDKALAIDPHNFNALANKGVALYRLGKYNDAIVSYNKALALNPNDADTINNKANALGKLGKSLEAIQLYQRAIKNENDVSNIQSVDFGYNDQNQKIITIQMNLARAAANATPPRYNLSITTYTEILHDDPHNGCAYLGRADVYKKMGQLDNYNEDEELGNMLKPTCSTVSTNFPKPPQPDLGQSILSFVSKFNVFQPGA